MAGYEDEKRALESASDVLKTLSAQLRQTEQALEKIEAQLEGHRDKRAKAEQKKSDAGNNPK